MPRSAIRCRLVLALTAVAGPLMLAGCADLDASGFSTSRTEGWSQIHLPNVTRDAAFDAAVYATRQWFRLEQVSPADGTIKSATTEYEQRGGTGRIRDAAIGFKNRMRHSANVVVRPEGTGAVARCMVTVQRLDTADHRVFRDNSRFDDRPGDTPIDRDAGISSAQDQVWTDMPRDRKLESDILEVIRARVAGGEQPTTAKS